MPPFTRCKFRCSWVKESVGYVYNPDAKTNEQKIVYEAGFTVVTGGSEENKAFFASTPTGTVLVGTHLPDTFAAGQEYYFDISLA